MASSYTGSNDCSRVQLGEDADLTQEELEVMVQGMTGGRLHSGSSDPSLEHHSPLRGSASENGGAGILANS